MKERVGGRRGGRFCFWAYRWAPCWARGRGEEATRDVRRVCSEDRRGVHVLMRVLRDMIKDCCLPDNNNAETLTYHTMRRETIWISTHAFTRRSPAHAHVAAPDRPTTVKHGVAIITGVRP